MKKRQTPKPIRRTPLMDQRNAEGLTPTQETQLAELLEQLRPSLVDAVRSGAYMVSVFHLNGGNIDMRRITKDYPVSEFAKAVEVLELSCIEERKRIRETDAGLLEDTSVPF